jgi:hypothetical protein
MTTRLNEHLGSDVRIVPWMRYENVAQIFGQRRRRSPGVAEGFLKKWRDHFQIAYFQIADHTRLRLARHALPRSKEEDFARGALK